MNYDELPSRGKMTSYWEKIRDCDCGGRAYINYDENREYSVYCEKGGYVCSFKTTSLDMAIRLWNVKSAEVISIGGVHK